MKCLAQILKDVVSGNWSLLSAELHQNSSHTTLKKIAFTLNIGRVPDPTSDSAGHENANLDANIAVGTHAPPLTSWCFPETTANYVANEPMAIPSAIEKDSGITNIVTGQAVAGQGRPKASFAFPPS